MSPPRDSFYAQWRIRHGAAAAFRDAGDAPPERLLQAVWQHQRLRRDQLRTLDGETVRVLHPGFMSVGGGPDFRGAVIRIGDEPARVGDVEVDVRTNGWHAHGHDRNPNFKNVILHVVWDANGNAGGMKTISIRDALDSPLAELAVWLEREPVRPLPENLRGKCSAPLRKLDDADLTALLHEAALVRFQSKAAQFSARARQAGWEQSLWEGLFRALGYKNNSWPMHSLAETRPRWAARDASPAQLQARMLGVAGLLPAELTRAQSGTDGYLKTAWAQWWRERDGLDDCVLPRAAWRFDGLRPANHPQRRLALASHWLADGKFVPRIEKWCAGDFSEGRLLGSLTEVLDIGQDEFWSWHWTFRSARMKKPQPLLGEKRVTDFAINVILPWLWTRANEGGNEKLSGEILRRHFAWPAAEDNSVLRLARERLLGGRRGVLRSAAAQQGLMQVVRDFCDHSDATCEHCTFPDLVRGWTAQRAAAPTA